MKEVVEDYWLAPAAIQMKMILEDMPRGLTHFNLNMYYDDSVFFLSLIKSPGLIELIKHIPSSSISNVWSIFNILKEDDTSEFKNELSELRELCADARFFYSKERDRKVEHYRATYTKLTGSNFPDEILTQRRIECNLK